MAARVPTPRLSAEVQPSYFDVRRKLPLIIPSLSDRARPIRTNQCDFLGYGAVGHRTTDPRLLSRALRNTRLGTRRSPLHQARWYKPSLAPLRARRTPAGIHQVPNLPFSFPLPFFLFCRRSVCGTLLRQDLRNPAHRGDHHQAGRCHTTTFVSRPAKVSLYKNCNLC